LTIYFCLSRI